MKITVRKPSGGDLTRLHRLVSRIDLFNRQEKSVAHKLIESSASQGWDAGDYHLLLAEDGRGRVVGYVCYGPSPMTQGTWDLYWIAVDFPARKKGVGSALLREVQRRIKGLGGKRLIIDTSSQPSYAPARALYQSLGFRPVGIVPDYYRKGWHRITFFKYL